MNLKTFLSFKALVSMVVGFTSLCIPTVIFPYYGVNLDAQGVGFSQLFGTMTIGIGFICWFARTESRSALRQNILLSLFICDTIGFFVALIGQIKGITNMLGWGNVALWLILAIGLGYFRFVKQD